MYERACAPVWDAMDLAYLTGQRPGDVFGLREIDIRDGALELAQSKTGKKLRIAVTGELAGAGERIMERNEAQNAPPHLHPPGLSIPESQSPQDGDRSRLLAPC